MTSGPGPGMGNAPRPPRLVARILARVLRRDPAGPAILGDLHEDFVRTHREQGPAAARRRYCREALALAFGRVCRAPLRRLGRAGAGSDSPSRQGVRRMAPRLRGILQDAAYAARSLRRNAGFALFTAAVIGLGVGAATAVYSVLEPLVLAPLPFPEPEELVWISNDATPGDNSLSSVTSRTANLHDFREQALSFAGITGYDAFFRENAYTLTGTGEPERLVGVGVAHDFLDVLEIEPLHGRSFTVEEGREGGPAAVILSHGFWTRRFGGDRGIVGRAITLNDAPHAVVGVLPPRFDFATVFAPGGGVDLLLPFPVLPAGGGGFQGNVLSIVGRLRPGVTPEAAQAELDGILAGLGEAQPGRWGLAADVSPLQAHVVGPFRTALLLLAAAAGTLLLIVCVNVSNLLLARSPGRVREMAVRKALGASRRRLARQLLLETMAIALAGAAVGAGIAWGVTRFVAGTAGIAIPLMERVAVDGSALLFSGAVALLTGLATGLVSALQVPEGGEAAALQAAGPGSSRGRRGRRIQEALVVAQVALACALLVGGGLLVRSFRAVLDVDLGFDPANVVAWQLNPGEDFGSFQEESGFFRALVDRVEHVPGVESAGLIDALPLGRNRSWPMRVVGRPDDEDDDDPIYPHVIDPGYLRTLGIALVEGRNFTERDTWHAPRVVMMNESGARRVFGGGDALGRKLRFWGPWEWEVVGIVRDVRHLSPEMGPGTQVYFPLAQMSDFTTLDLAVCSPLPPERIAGAVAAALEEVDPSMPTREFWTLRSTVDRATSARRFTVGILGTYGLAALFLAGLGIYGVLAHSVAERRPEIGIRMALGASAPEIVRRVLGRTLALVAAGIAGGAVLSLVGLLLLRSLLFGVGPADPVTLAGSVLVLLLVAVAAAAVPAARAARVGGGVALRAGG